MNDIREFFKFVIPSVIAFALSGLYAIVDGFFVGNTIGDAGLSAINIAYPIVAVLQALGTGIGMGGAVYYSIHKAKGTDKKAREFVAVGWWILLIVSVVATVIVYFSAENVLKLLGADHIILQYATDYIKIIAIGAVLQIIGTGMIPFIRNYGGSLWAMIAMIGGFATNIILDYLFIWSYGLGMKGAASATIIGQGVTMTIAIIYAICKRKFYLRADTKQIKAICGSIVKVGLAPFGLALTPNLSLVLINRFSASYGGEKAIATYACISYVICIIYLVLQGVGDGSQPIISEHYGEGNLPLAKTYRTMAYLTAGIITVVCMVGLFLARGQVGVLFGASAETCREVEGRLPLFLGTLVFVAFIRVTTSYLYATEKAALSYILVYTEPVLSFAACLLLPRKLGLSGVWIAVPCSQVLSGVIAFVIKQLTDRRPEPAED